MTNTELNNKLIELEPMLKKIVMSSFTISSNNYDDCLQEARIAAMKAILKFDEEKGYKFETFLTNVVRNEIRMFFNRENKNKYFCTDFSEESGYLDFQLEDNIAEEKLIQLEEDFRRFKIMQSLEQVLTRQEYTLVSFLNKGYTYKQIDKLMNINTNNRLQLVHNIKNKINNFNY